MRFLAVYFPDWSVTAAGYQPGDLVAFSESGAVSVCSAAAQASGVHPGQRRREAKRHCPMLTVLPTDPYRDAQAFEPIIAALTAVVPRLEVTTAGLCTMVADGPSRYYGSEQALAGLIETTAIEAIESIGASSPSAHPTHPNTTQPEHERLAFDLLHQIKQPPAVTVGIADSRFAAGLAARHSLIVPIGRTAQFLAPLPMATLGIDELTVLSGRLGIHTLGQFAQLPSRSVLSRFGTAAGAAHRMARGKTGEPLAIHETLPTTTVTTYLDPPAERVDIATFASRASAGELVDLLTRRGLSCTVLRIDAETEHGEVLTRLWRASPVFDVDTIIERVRWQMSGWLEARNRDPRSSDLGKSEQRPTAGITAIRLHADQVANAADLQVSLWGELSDTDRRAIRGLDRVRGLLGPDGIFTAVLNGGRGPSERAILVPWGEPTPTADPTMPWPGQLRSPAPTLVHPEPLPVEVVGESGPVQVTSRGELSDHPARIRLPNDQWQTVTAWAGPWLTDEQWWDRQAHRRQARFQLLTADAGAYLCTVQRNRWRIEASYD
ncbi:MAG: DNA polymerase Y family protein [Actinomycetes bacterium]